MKKSGSNLKEIETAIRQLSPEEQKKLLRRFPKLVPTQPIKAADLDWLRAANPSFCFWDNPEDEIYDAL